METTLTEPPDPAPLGPRDRAVLYSLAGFSAVVYACHSLLRHATFRTNAYDLGIFDQAVRGYAGFGAPVSSIKGPGFNLLGDHFHPVLVVLAPLYWAWDDPRVLLLAQAALVAASIVPVYLMARARLDAWSAGLVAFGYAFSWPVQAMVDFDFHEVAFALPLLAWTIYWADRDRPVRALLVASLLLLVREDMGILLVTLGVVFALRRQWVPAVVAAAGGLGAYYLVTAAIIPALGTGFAYWEYQALGPDMPSAVRYIVTNPVGAGRIFFDGTKQRTLSLLLAQSGMLSIGSPYALLALPLLAQRFFSARENLWAIGFHYDAPIMVILVVAFVDVLRRIRAAFPVVARLLAATLAATVVTGTLADRLVFPLGNVPQMVAALDGERVRQARAARDAVPPGVCVEADGRFVPQLTPRNDVVLPGESKGRASWLLLDLSKSDVGKEPFVPPWPYFNAAAEAGFEAVAAHGHFRVLHRPGPDARDCHA